MSLDPSLAGSPVDRPEYEAGTEGLRGFCALVVLYTHWLAPFTHVDLRYAPSSVFWWFEAGQGAVLLFFVLSGYVIGLTNQRPFSQTASVDYARRRLVRLVPLYVIAVALSFAVRPIDSWRTVLGNLLFLQNDVPLGPLHVPLLQSNTNLWSLNYEALYYVLFVFVWLSPRRWPLWLGASTLIATVGWHVAGIGTAVATYAAGWMFWLAGYGLARSPRSADRTNSSLPWPSLLLLWIATWHLKPLWWLAHRLNLLPDGNSWMNYSFCDLIPVCIALLMAASHRRPRAAPLIAWSALIIPAGFVLWRIARGGAADPMITRYGLLIAAAALAWRWRPSPRWFDRLAPVGLISYALYIFQRPVQWLVLDHIPLPSGTRGTFLVRLALIAILTFALSYVGERIVQPRIRRWLSPKRPNAPVPQPAPVA